MRNQAFPLSCARLPSSRDLLSIQVPGVPTAMVALFRGVLQQIGRNQGGRFSPIALDMLAKLSPERAGPRLCKSCSRHSESAGFVGAGNKLCRLRSTTFS